VVDLRRHGVNAARDGRPLGHKCNTPEMKVSMCEVVSAQVQEHLGRKSEAQAKGYVSRDLLDPWRRYVPASLILVSWPRWCLMLGCSLAGIPGSHTSPARSQPVSDLLEIESDAVWRQPTPGLGAPNLGQLRPKYPKSADR